MLACVVMRTARGKAQRLLERQLVRRDSDYLAVTVDDQTRLCGARDFDGTQPRAAQRSECCKRHRGWGCIDSHGLPPEAIKTGTSPELSYNIQASTSGL